MASERGIMCARLAANGITANSKALEGELGFFHAYNWGQDIRDNVFNCFGNPWGLETPGISSIKLYPCCHGVATNIECGRRIHDKYRPSLDDVKEIEIHSQFKSLCSMLSKVYDDNGESLEWGYDGPPRRIKTLLPITGPQGKFSKEYTFSRAVMEGNVRLEHFTDKAVNDPQVKKWMDKIRVYHNSELEKYSNQYPEETAPHAERMIVRLRDGRAIREEEIFILGMTRRPLSFDDVVSKYHDCGKIACISGDKIDRIISLADDIDKLENVSELLSLLKIRDSSPLPDDSLTLHP